MLHSLHFLGSTIRIGYHRRTWDDTYPMGSSSRSKRNGNMIRILAGMPRDWETATLVHEFLHHAFRRASEARVMACEAAIMQIVRRHR